MSILDDLLVSLPQGTNFPLDPNHDPAISLPEPNKFFVRPPLRMEGTMPHKSVPIVIISAPGAVGKTELARFIASEKKSHVWNLSKLVLGTNTFRGTLAKSFAPMAYATILEQLQSAKILFILDAFDEVEIISGWQRIEEFISELVQFVKDAPNTCLVLLARSETATYMDMYLADLSIQIGTERQIHRTYSIDYFPKGQIEDFIDLQLDHLHEKKLKTSHRPLHRVHRASFENARDYVFQLFFEAVREDMSAKGAWSKNQVLSFLGYAPVLQAIARYLHATDNYGKVSNDLAKDKEFQDGASLVCTLMDELLRREQDKVIQPLQNLDIPEARQWEGWENVYTPSEQIQRLFLYTNSKKSQQPNPAFAVSPETPTWLVEHYRSALDRTLTNHPFVAGSNFAGPAFQDYVFARLLAERTLYEEVKSAWHDVTLNNGAYVASPLFALIYLKLSNARAFADITGYLYESAISRHTFQSEHRLFIIPRDNNIEDITTHYLTIVGNDELADPDLTFELTVNEEHPVTFAHQLTRAYVEVNGKIVLGKRGSNVELSDSQIMCNTLEILASSVVIRNYRNEERVILEAKNYIQQSYNLTVDCKDSDKDKVRINWKDGQKYPWSDYYQESSSFPSDHIKEATMAFKRILAFFRKDKKDTFARYKPFIDNKIVGRHELRQKMKTYLLRRKILYSNDALYFLDISMLAKSGINWTDIVGGKSSPELEKFIVSFLNDE